MFNQEQKERFILNYSSSVSVRSACIRLFNYTEKYEVKFTKDLCLFDKSEISEVVESVSTLRGSRSRVGIIVKYLDWCCKEQIPGAANNIEDIPSSSVQKMRARTVSNPLQLANYLDVVFGKEEEGDYDCLFRAFFWFSFSGLLDDDIIKLKNNNIDLSTMTVRYGNNLYPIYRESLRSINDCLHKSEFAQKNEKLGNSARIERISGVLLLRGKKDPDISNFRFHINKKGRLAFQNGLTDKRLSHYGVWLSGHFYRARELELAGGKVSFRELAIQTAEGIKDRAKITRLASSYKANYETWKLTNINVT